MKRSRALLASNPARDNQARAEKAPRSLDTVLDTCVGALLLPLCRRAVHTLSLSCRCLNKRVTGGPEGSPPISARHAVLDAESLRSALASLSQPSFAFAAALNTSLRGARRPLLAAAPAGRWTRVILFDRFAVGVVLIRFALGRGRGEVAHRTDAAQRRPCGPWRAAEPMQHV